MEGKKERKEEKYFAVCTLIFFRKPFGLRNLVENVFLGFFGVFSFFFFFLFLFSFFSWRED